MKLRLLFITSLTASVSWGFTSAFVNPRPSQIRKDGYRMVPTPAESSSSTNENKDRDAKKVGKASDTFLADFFTSECDDMNMPPSLSIIRRSFSQLLSGSDIRGTFVDHPRRGTMASVAQATSKSSLPALTPFAAHCFGYAFATMLSESSPKGEEFTICIGRDPRGHGTVLADAFGRGAGEVQNAQVVYTGIATTPAMFDFCREGLCDGGVMVTASHLPGDRNGLKFFNLQGGFTKAQVSKLIDIAKQHAQVWYDMGAIPPTSGANGVFCSSWVDFMPQYQLNLKNALMKQVHGEDATKVVPKQTLKGLKLVLNAGNGSGGFFQQVLEDLGADVTGSVHIKPDPSFPNGIPNPENESMIQETKRACEAANADLGIMLDTDADRCGLVVPRSIREDGSRADYEPLNRNRLIALMGVIFARASPGCAIVTCSSTSCGLEKFLQDELGLVHVRYLKGYANVINKAKSLTENNVYNAEVAIETSGHCALKENDYLDDGTYTAVKVIGLLAQERLKDPQKSLLDLIANLEEMDEEAELRMQVLNGSLESTQRFFDCAAFAIEENCSENSNWTIDKENLEGLRVSTGDGGFFMLRKSLHDPVVIIQVEASSKDAAREVVVEPLLELIKSEEIQSGVDLSALEKY